MKTKILGFFSLVIFVSFSGATTNFSKEWLRLLTNFQFEESKQSYCFEENGQIFGENIDLKVKPASVTKLYTTLWALDELGHDYRFITRFAIKNNDLYILGGLDPYFVTENLIVMITKLNQLGYDSFKNVYFDSAFYLNWSDDFRFIREKLNRILNTSKWTSREYAALEGINQFRAKNQQTSLENITLAVHRITHRRTLNVTHHDLIINHLSSPIWKHLKQVNMYSNNFYTDKIFFDHLGGPIVFSDYMYLKLSATEDDIYFFTGSGLGDNYTTCAVTLKMLEALEKEVLDSGLELKDILAIAGVDEGTLKNRFTKNPNKIAAKTGTLRDTSTLSGYLYTDNRPIRFGIFNHNTNRFQARSIQNEFIEYALEGFQTIRETEYVALPYLSIDDIIVQ
jgi:D-alanyl-D-alanine carboxypeptidase